jgi:16S rRNA C1402 (ribose-2'-O) methylase RsmI
MSIALLTVEDFRESERVVSHYAIRTPIVLRRAFRGIAAAIHLANPVRKAGDATAVQFASKKATS